MSDNSKEKGGAKTRGPRTTVALFAQSTGKCDARVQDRTRHRAARVAFVVSRPTYSRRSDINKQEKTIRTLPRIQPKLLMPFMHYFRVQMTGNAAR